MGFNKVLIAAINNCLISGCVSISLEASQYYVLNITLTYFKAVKKG